MFLTTIVTQAWNLTPPLLRRNTDRDVAGPLRVARAVGLRGPPTIRAGTSVSALPISIWPARDVVSPMIACWIEHDAPTIRLDLQCIADWQ